MQNATGCGYYDWTSHVVMLLLYSNRAPIPLNYASAPPESTRPYDRWVTVWKGLFCPVFLVRAITQVLLGLLTGKGNGAGFLQNNYCILWLCSSRLAYDWHEKESKWIPVLLYMDTVVRGSLENNELTQVYVCWQGRSTRQESECSLQTAVYIKVDSRSCRFMDDCLTSCYVYKLHITDHDFQLRSTKTCLPSRQCVFAVSSSTEWARFLRLV